MNVYAHPRFRDVVMLVISKKIYKAGFVDIKFNWLYPPCNGVNRYRLISRNTCKLRITNNKWDEFYIVYKGEV